MYYLRLKLLLPLLAATAIMACSDDPAGLSGDIAMDDTEIALASLVDSDWTLESVRGSDGEYNPLPLDAIWRLSFRADGFVEGDALCNNGGGSWQADDSTLSLTSWSEDTAFCEASETISIDVRNTIKRLFAGETMMSTIDTGRLFLETGDTEQLVFSGRLKREDEQSVSVETLLRSGGGERAGSADPVFGDLATPYVIYRDIESLDADYALLPESNNLPDLPEIDFTNSIVIGAYLPLDGQISSDVFVRRAHESQAGLEIEIARFGKDVPDESNTVCAAADAMSAPWTLVRIDSVLEPLQFEEMARAFCTGIPSPD